MKEYEKDVNYTSDKKRETFQVTEKPEEPKEQQ